MKTNLFFTFLIIPILSFAQLREFPTNTNGEIEFSEVVECKQPVDIMYKNAKEWIALTFGDYKSVIQFEDDKNYKLILKGLSKLPQVDKVSVALGFKSNLNYTITFDFKESKYRYRLSDLIVMDEINFKSYPRKVGEQEKLLINGFNHKLDSLQKIDLSLLKKKDKEHTQDEIKQAEQISAEELKKYNAEYDTVMAIINSIKNAIPKSDNF